MGGVLVVGLQRSGLGAANLMAAMGRDVTVTDLRKEAELADFARQLAPEVGLALGGHTDGLFLGADLIVLSPGVPHDIGPVRLAREAGVEVIGELEFSYRLLPGVPFYAVTGTNGKSTTVTLLERMMRLSALDCVLAGNIGNALTGEILDRLNGSGRPAGIECVVVEVSSFQLDTVNSFRPRGSAILNITPDHMDRYASMQEYRASKARIFANQRDGDFVLLNADDPECMRAIKEHPPGGSRPDVYYFSRREKVRGVYLEGGSVHWDLGPTGRGALVRADEIRIKGVHNLENAMAASAMALLAGCPPGLVAQALGEFGGLPHRLEPVRELGGVSYVNDSKGTNVGAVLKSLEGFSSQVILIAGGRDKGGDFTLLRDAVRRNVKALVLIGEAGEKIKQALGDICACFAGQSLEDAVRKARGLAAPGDVVLLSPGCASFDMFRDFEERGEAFRKAVEAL